jgi:hypothetical protein
MSSPASNDAIGETTSAFYLCYRQVPPTHEFPRMAKDSHSTPLPVAGPITLRSRPRGTAPRQ